MASTLVTSPTAETFPTVKRTAKHRYPSLYQINTRLTLRSLSQRLHRNATLEDISDDLLDSWAAQGFDWIYLLGVWQTGSAGQKVSREDPRFRQEFLETLPDLCLEDVCGSCFAVTRYTVASEMGADSALEHLRVRLHERGLSLMLDFVPNHSALDHPWVWSHPEFYIEADEDQQAREPHNYVRVVTCNGPAIMAYGRDPYFPGWPDTLQLNYAEPSLQDSMRRELQSVAEMCDGVRCDMAMLILPEVFERTWGLHADSFWPEAIKSVGETKPDFLFMAEVYWDLEWELQQQGFDYTYDKRLYDRLREKQAKPVRDHFRADLEFQRRSARFLENHDEPRAAATFPPEVHRAAAVLTYLCPGLRFFHDGQFEGRTKKVSVHLGRRSEEKVDASLVEFYRRLLACLNRIEIKDGIWQLLDCMPAWDGNWTADCFICFAWGHAAGERTLVAVNFAANRSQCYVKLPFEEVRGSRVRLSDFIGSERYEREGQELLYRGLYLDLPAWGYNVFEITTSSK